MRLWRCMSWQKLIFLSSIIDNWMFFYTNGMTNSNIYTCSGIWNQLQAIVRYCINLMLALSTPGHSHGSFLNIAHGIAWKGHAKSSLGMSLQSHACMQTCVTGMQSYTEGGLIVYFPVCAWCVTFSHHTSLVLCTFHFKCIVQWYMTLFCYPAWLHSQETGIGSTCFSYSSMRSDHADIPVNV